MVRTYAAQRVSDQAKSVAFILCYLVAFQVLVIGTAPQDAARIAVGIGMVILGLAFFLEGLFLGLMPLGEQVGLQLPRRGGIVTLIAFGLLLGIGSTLAEPAVASLRILGQRVNAWEAPLLYRLLENEPGKLVGSIGIGVGLAVALGMIRFAYGGSVKRHVCILVPLLLAASLWASTDAGLVSLIGLAWDAGAVTTGPVTVPLVLALGIGVSRAAGKQEDASDGFGIIMLASALPVLAVLSLGAWLQASTPHPVSETEFFAPGHRAEAMRLFGSEEELARHAFRRGGEAARVSLFSDESAHRAAVRSLGEPAGRLRWLGDLALADWLEDRASAGERSWLPHGAREEGGPESGVAAIPRILARESAGAVRAIVPLTALLLIVLILFLRDRPRFRDEIALGIGLALVGMTLLASGIRLGMAPLGDQVGRPLPGLFRNDPQEVRRILIESFDPDTVQSAIGPDGTRIPVILRVDRRGIPRAEPFDASRFDPDTGRYEHVVTRVSPAAVPLTAAGIVLVLLFAFGLGFGSTLAEPALAALGRTVEELTAGTIRRAGLVRAVSVGVGLGLVLGVARILYGIPTVWLIAPPYLLLVPLTLWSEEDFAGIAWDSGGVTTGIVTVPLVLAMGLGIGNETGAADGFGVLAMASVYPIVTVLLYGFLVRMRHRRSLRTSGEEAGDE